MKKKRFVLSFIVSLFFAAFFLEGCEPSYPKEKLAEHVGVLCKEEFNIDTKAEVFGNTLAIYIPMQSLFDLTFGLSEEAQEVIQNVLMVSSRAVLSTDKGIDFYCIIVQDVRLPELQVVIVKNVEDVKRSFYGDISRGEYFKRTLFDININPQSQKERTIKSIFSKHDLEEKWQESLIDEFFRSSPSNLKEFGYWNDKFYAKEITLGEFLAEQLAYRIRINLRENKELEKQLLIKNIEGAYVVENDLPFFDIAFDIQTKEMLAVAGQKISKEELFTNIIEEVTLCLYGYGFQDFVFVKIFDINTKDTLLITKMDLYKYKKKKIKIADVLKGINKGKIKKQSQEVIVVQMPYQDAGTLRGNTARGVKPKVT
ncbi:MAG: hypothetical protein PHQ52_01505 [Candidatus Omnitrophica bacterium]|nr:hypothetical protein [Candidatus Omnitrophota bacterium]